MVSLVCTMAVYDPLVHGASAFFSHVHVADDRRGVASPSNVVPHQRLVVPGKEKKETTSSHSRGEHLSHGCLKHVSEGGPCATLETK